MKRSMVGIVGAALLLVMTVGVTAAASRSVFTGAWTSIDNSDGSTQRLEIGGGLTPTITVFDDHASFCLSRGAVTGALTASGSGVVSDLDLIATMRRASCGSFEVLPAILDINYTYDPSTGTLLDLNGNTWHRLP